MNEQGILALSRSTSFVTAHMFVGIPTVVIPASLLPELRKLPDDVLSRAETVVQASKMITLSKQRS